MPIATISVKTLECTHLENILPRPTKNQGLHSPTGAAIATFFGGPFASAVIIAVNCLKLNEWLNAALSFFVGLFATTMLMVAALFFQVHLGFAAIAGVVMSFLAKQITQTMFMASIDDQLDAGIQLKSPWIGALIGLFTLVAQVGFLSFIYAAV